MSDELNRLYRERTALVAHLAVLTRDTDLGKKVGEEIRRYKR